MVLERARNPAEDKERSSEHGTGRSRTGYMSYEKAWRRDKVRSRGRGTAWGYCMAHGARWTRGYGAPWRGKERSRQHGIPRGVVHVTRESMESPRTDNERSREHSIQEQVYGTRESMKFRQGTKSDRGNTAPKICSAWESRGSCGRAISDQKKGSTEPRGGTRHAQESKDPRGGADDARERPKLCGRTNNDRGNMAPHKGVHGARENVESGKGTGSDRENMTHNERGHVARESAGPREVTRRNRGNMALHGGRARCMVHDA